MTPQEAAREAARKAAELVRFLNHHTRPVAGQDDDGLDVVDVYDLLAELALLTARLPQLFDQLETIVDDLVERDQVLVVDGPDVGDPAAAAAITGHWLTTANTTAHALARHVDSAHQTLTWAAAQH